MAYLHNNEYYTGYFAEGSSDYAGQQGPGYTHMTVNPTTNSAKTVNIYFAEPVICNSASGTFSKASAPATSVPINVQYRLSSTKAWTSTRPSEPIDAMILTNKQISGYSQGLSGFAWSFESKFTWGEEVPEPETTTKYYYIRGTGGVNSCTTMGVNLSGNLAFECVIKLNGINFTPWGISPDSGWGGSDSSDLRFFTTYGASWYCDWGSYRNGPNALPGGSDGLLAKIQNNRIKVRVTKTNITITNDETGELILESTLAGSGTPSGPWMMGTTNNFQFYEGKVWNADTDQILIDCKAHESGLYNRLTSTYYGLTYMAYGNYDEVEGEPPVVYPDLTPQVDNYSSIASSGLYLRRRAVSFAKPITYSIVEYISWPNNRSWNASDAYKIVSNGFNWANHKVIIVADLSGTTLISGFQNLYFCGVPTSPNVRIDVYRGGAINYGFFGTNVDFSLNSSAPTKDPLNDKYYTVWSSGGIWMYYSAGTLDSPFLYGGEYLKRTGSPNITTNGPFYMYRNSFAVKFYGMEIYTNPGNTLVKRLLPCEYDGLDCLVDVDNKKIYLPDGSDPLNI